MLNRWIVLFCLPLFFLSAINGEESFIQGTVPAWVQPCDFDKDALPMKGSDENIQILLEDRQTNWEEQTRYVHKAIKILTQSGAHIFTQLEIGFDPVYQHLDVYDLHVIRDGKIINCLEKSRHQLIQSENSLEENVYVGDLSLVFFLNDIRAGDILEFSFSTVGFNPYVATHCDEWIDLYYKSPVMKDKVFHRLLLPSDKPIQLKSDNPELAPKIVEHSPTLTEWVWEASHTPASSDDNRVPSWHGLFGGRIQISQFKSWQEVAQKELTFYEKFEDAQKNPSSEMIFLIQQWTESAKEDHERALLALRFVQDEVKYMGFHDGMGGVQPTDPRIVLERRFGDCKDKSVLLHSLLKLMQISSTPVIVDSAMGKKLPDLLPTSNFDHVILRIEINGSHYWVDPVISFQGGSLQRTYCPAYHWGLVLSPETIGLTPIPLPVLEKPIEIYSAIKMISPNEAELKIERINYGFVADEVRSVINEIGLKKLSEIRLELTQKVYKSASIVSTLCREDDREKNVIKGVETYKISTRSRLGKKFLRVCSSVLESHLAKYVNLERFSPYQLKHPLWVKEHIHIENPFNEWAADAEETSFENEAIKFNYEMKKEGHTADFHFELKHLQDHVPVSLSQDYWNIIQEIEPNPSLEVVITAPTPK